MNRGVVGGFRRKRRYRSKRGARREVLEKQDKEQ